MTAMEAFQQMLRWGSDTTVSPADATPSRRALLKALGVAGGAVVATAVGATPALGRKKKKIINGAVVYRLSSRGSSSCRACQKHHRFFVFTTHALASANRAHPGCNCPITTQELPQKTVKRLFPAESLGVVDLRKVDPQRRA